MIKNQIFSFIEEPINSFLYGFSKDQLDAGILSGNVKLENLNIKPDYINNGLDEIDFPFWLKAGLISKMSICGSLMNFIGEKPIEVNIEKLDIIISPNLKWIIQNLKSYISEDLEEMKSEYIPYNYNPFNIFNKKRNASDSPVYTNKFIEEIFKDKTNISNFLNIILFACFKYYYSPNFLLKLELKDIHIRFEDDQLIDYMGKIALGIKVSSLELNLSSEAKMKKNNFEITNFDIYLENNADILIPCSLLYDSIKNGALNENYYTNLKKINFQNHKYKEDTKLILQNFNCSCNFGTKAINQGKIDFFGKQENNNYKLYIQFESKEINIKLFPDFYIITNNFINFIKKFLIISDVQKFKPKKKPYNEKNKKFIELLNYMNSNENTSFSTKFSYKRKMIVRDWLLYFYLCKKCKSFKYNYSYNPLRPEFNRYYNLCVKGNNIIKINKEVDKNGKENQNPDNINLLLEVDIKIEGLNLDLHSSISSYSNDEFISIKMNNFDSKIILNKNKFDLNFTVKNVTLGPNKLNQGEKVFISNNSMKKREMNCNTKYNNKTFRKRNINYNNDFFDDCDSSMGIPGLLKKYNPNINERLNFIGETMENINSNSKRERLNFTEKNSKKKKRFFNKGDEQKNKENKVNQRNYNSNYSSKKDINFSKEYMKTFEINPNIQKLELDKEKSNFNISRKIIYYNNNKLNQKYRNFSKEEQNNKNSNSKENNEQKMKINFEKMPRNQYNSEITHTNKIIPLNLFEMDSNNNSHCFSFKFHKTSDNSTMDVIQILLGTIRVNLFSDYMIKCANVLKEFEYSKIKSIRNDLSSLDDDLDIDKKLYMMEKYFYEKLNKLPQNKKTEQIKSYMAYLKNKIEKTENYEIEYLLSIFSKGVKINIDYDNLECIYYSNKNNKVCGKAIMPSPIFNLFFNSSKISFKIFDFEFEIDDLDNAKLLFKTLNTILEDKFKMAQLLIKSSLSQIKKDLKKKENELNPKQIENNNHNLNIKKSPKKNLNLNEIFFNSDERNLNIIKEESEKEIIHKEKPVIDILNNTQNKDNNIIYENDNLDNNDNEIIAKIETKAQENNEKDLLENTLKENSNNDIKKGQTNINFITNKKYTKKESDKEINITVQEINNNNSKLNLIMRNNNFFNIKNNAFNRYNNSYELKDPNNKSVNNKKNLNIDKAIDNKKNNINLNSIEIHYDNNGKEKTQGNIIQSKNKFIRFENKKENKLIENKYNNCLTDRNKSKDNILPTSKLSNKRIDNDCVLSASNLINNIIAMRKKKIVKRKLPQVIREPHNSKK